MAPRSRSLSRSRSKSRSPYRRPFFCSRKSRSRSHSPIYKRRSYSRSRRKSKSHTKRRSYSRSRSKSKSHTRFRSCTKSSRSPMSTRKRHVGDREAPPSGKCLGIFGLSLYTTERQLRTLFEKYGKVEECRVVKDNSDGGRSRGFGFVNMGTVVDAKNAKEQLNGEALDGRCIRVDFSITKRAHTPTPGKYLGQPDLPQHRGRSMRHSLEGGASKTRHGGGGHGSSSRGYTCSRSRSRSQTLYFRDLYL